MLSKLGAALSFVALGSSLVAATSVDPSSLHPLNRPDTQLKVLKPAKIDQQLQARDGSIAFTPLEFIALHYVDGMSNESQAMTGAYDL